MPRWNCTSHCLVSYNSFLHLSLFAHHLLSTGEQQVGSNPCLQSRTILLETGYRHFNLTTLVYRVHQRALRVMLGDYESTFECLLTKNNEIVIHTKNLQKLMTEVYKSLNQESPSFMGEFFVQRELTYDLRIKNTLQIPPTKTISFGIKSLAFRGSILWNSMPDTIKC